MWSFRLMARNTFLLFFPRPPPLIVIVRSIARNLHSYKCRLSSLFSSFDTRILVIFFVYFEVMTGKVDRLQSPVSRGEYRLILVLQKSVQVLPLLELHLISCFVEIVSRFVNSLTGNEKRLIDFIVYLVPTGIRSLIIVTYGGGYNVHTYYVPTVVISTVAFSNKSFSPRFGCGKFKKRKKCKNKIICREDKNLTSNFVL